MPETMLKILKSIKNSLLILILLTSNTFRRLESHHQSMMEHIPLVIIAEVVKIVMLTTVVNL